MAVNRYENYGGDDRKILAYALFFDYKYGSGLGVDTLIASATTVQELKELPEVDACPEYYEWQIVDTSTLKVTDAGSDDGDIIVNGVEI